MDNTSVNEPGRLAKIEGVWKVYDGQTWHVVPELAGIPQFMPRVKNHACNETSQPPTQGENIMTETNLKTVTETETAVAPVVVEPNWLQKMVIKHPRTSKVAAITGATLSVLAVAMMINNVQNSKDHADQSTDLTLDELQEMSKSMSPTDTTN